MDKLQVGIKKQLERRDYMKKTKKMLLWIFGASLLSILGCAKVIGYTNISPKDALELIKGGSKPILIDVRTPEEFRVLRIPGSVLIPDYEIKDRITDVVPDKETTIIVYCRSGNRSRKAAKELINMGYTKVFDLGGIIDWPYDTEGDDEI
ncbi:MAG: rhodanese-like domain-containing protein [Acetivibrionales bacterium]